MLSLTRGGVDSKYRKLRGLGEFAKQSKNGIVAGNVKQCRQKENRGGGIPWRLAALTGVLTTDNCVDIRLQKNNRQLPDTKDAEHSSNTKEEKSDSGEYP